MKKDYFEDNTVKPKDEILERQVRIDLSPSENSYAKSEYRKFNIPENLVFSSIIVDGMYTFLPPQDTSINCFNGKDKLRPRPHVCVYVCKRIHLYTFMPSVHT